MWSSLRGSKQLQQQSHNNNHAATRRFPSYFLILIFISIVIYLSYPLMYLSDNDAYQKHTDSVAIVVLGGGLTNDGRVPSHTQLRLDKAVSLYHHTYNKQATIITLSGGTPHKPNPLDSKGFPVWEASAAAKQLLEMGIPASQVFEENFSLDTVGNVSLSPSSIRVIFAS